MLLEKQLNLKHVHVPGTRHQARVVHVLKTGQMLQAQALQQLIALAAAYTITQSEHSAPDEYALPQEWQGDGAHTKGMAGWFKARRSSIGPIAEGLDRTDEETPPASPSYLPYRSKSQATLKKASTAALNRAAASMSVRAPQNPAAGSADNSNEGLVPADDVNVPTSPTVLERANAWVDPPTQSAASTPNLVTSSVPNSPPMGTRPASPRQPFTQPLRESLKPSSSVTGSGVYPEPGTVAGNAAAPALARRGSVGIGSCRISTSVNPSGNLASRGSVPLGLSGSSPLLHNKSLRMQQVCQEAHQPRRRLLRARWRYLAARSRSR